MLLKELANPVTLHVVHLDRPWKIVKKITGATEAEAKKAGFKWIDDNAGDDIDNYQLQKGDDTNTPVKESGWDRFNPDSEQHYSKDAEYNRHGQGKYDKPGKSGLTNAEIEGKDFYASDVSNEEDYVMVLVRNANEESDDYHGVNVLLYPDGKVDASTADDIADKEWEDHKAEITKIAKAKAGVKEGTLTELSRQTVGSYRKKAQADLDATKAKDKKGNEEDGWNYQDSQEELDAWIKMDKRKKGLARANGETVKESEDAVKAMAKRIEMYMREMRKQGEMADIEDALGSYSRDMRKAGVTRDEVYAEWRKTYN
jgi:hypothetical protein